MYISLEDFTERNPLYLFIDDVNYYNNAGLTQEQVNEYANLLADYDDSVLNWLCDTLGGQEESGEEFIHDTYKNMLGRDDSEEENASWNERMKTKNRVEIIKDFLSSNEFGNRYGWKNTERTIE